MQNSRSVKQHVKAQSKSVAASSDGVTANQVIDTLMQLFRDLGLNVAHPIFTPDNAGTAKTAAHTLYPSASEIGELLTHWHQDPAFLDESGNPSRIKFGGRGASFRRLAQLKAPNINVSYLISELERLGAVTVDENKLVSVHMRSFPVYEDKRLAVQHTLSVLDGFIKTLRHNLHSSPSNSDQLFHRVTWNDAFDRREIPALKVRVKKHGQTFLESFDDWLMRKALPKTSKEKPGSKRSKVSIGVYLSIEPK